mgnify:CR=1 FL=1
MFKSKIRALFDVPDKAHPEVGVLTAVEDITIFEVHAPSAVGTAL